MVAEIILGSAVLLLAAANGYVFLKKPEQKRPTIRQMAKTGRLIPRAVSVQENYSEEIIEDENGDLPAGANEIMQANPALFDRRIDIINKRISRLENILLKLENGGTLERELEISTVAKRLDRLDDFRRDMKIEIEALKQHISRIQKNGNGIKIVSESKEKDAELSKRIHDLVFRASSR